MGSIDLVISGLPLEAPDVGVGVYTRRLLEGLARNPGPLRARVLLPAGWPEGGVPEGMEVVRVPGRSPVSHPLLRAMWWARRVLAFVSERAGGAVFHSPAPIAGGPRPDRAVVTLHDCLYRRFPRYQGRWGVRSWWLRGTERFAEGCDLVLTDSIAALHDLAELAKLPRDRLAVWYPWVGREYDVTAARADVQRVRAALALPERYWLYVGGYDYRKDVETLLKAYAMTTDRLATPPLVLAGAIPKSGGGPVCDVRGCLSRIGLDGERVRMPGRVAAEDLPALYAGAEFLVYPSRGEGFGLPPAEALAVGTPALVADVSSLPEVVTDAAWRFEPGNAEALSRRMSEAAAGWLPAPAPLPGAFHEAEAIRHYHQLIGRVSEARER